MNVNVTQTGQQQGVIHVIQLTEGGQVGVGLVPRLVDKLLLEPVLIRLHLVADPAVVDPVPKFAQILMMGHRHQ